MLIEDGENPTLKKYARYAYTTVIAYASGKEITQNLP
jgi:hypothetical protein